MVICVDMFAYAITVLIDYGRAETAYIGTGRCNIALSTSDSVEVVATVVWAQTPVALTYWVSFSTNYFWTT